MFHPHGVFELLVKPFLVKIFSANNYEFGQMFTQKSSMQNIEKQNWLRHISRVFLQKTGMRAVIEL